MFVKGIKEIMRRPKSVSSTTWAGSWTVRVGPWTSQALVTISWQRTLFCVQLCYNQVSLIHWQRERVHLFWWRPTLVSITAFRLLFLVSTTAFGLLFLVSVAVRFVFAVARLRRSAWCKHWDSVLPESKISYLTFWPWERLYCWEDGIQFDPKVCIYNWSLTSKVVQCPSPFETGHGEPI